jgi:hypothetical protein
MMAHKRSESYEELEADMIYEHGASMWAVMKSYITDPPVTLQRTVSETLYSSSGGINEIRSKLRAFYDELGLE